MCRCGVSQPLVTHSVTRVTMSVTVSGLRFLSPQHDTRPWLTTVHCPGQLSALSSSSFLGAGHHTSVTTPTPSYQLQEYFPERYLDCRYQRSFPRTNSDATGGISTLHLYTQCGRRRCDMSSLLTINLSSFFLRYIIYVTEISRSRVVSNNCKSLSN